MNEAENYLQAPVIGEDSEIPVLQLWKRIEPLYPSLALMARDILAVPGMLVFINVTPKRCYRLSIHKPYGYGKTIWNFHMDMDCMDIWITYGHTEINLASGYNTAFQTWASRYTSSHSGL